MLPADQKKKNNLAEYIIYMYQTEELIRSYNFDLNDITTFVVVNTPISPSFKKKLILWYAEVIEQMISEGLNEKAGHSIKIQSEVAKLEDLHKKLLSTDSVYKEIFDIAQPSIQKHIKQSKNEISSEVQICLNSVYGMLLLKLHGKNLQKEQQDSVEQQGELLSYLSKIYKLQQKKTSE